jgi:hypothetical protein
MRTSNRVTQRKSKRRVQVHTSRHTQGNACVTCLTCCIRAHVPQKMVTHTGAQGAVGWAEQVMRKLYTDGNSNKKSSSAAAWNENPEQIKRYAARLNKYEVTFGTQKYKHDAYIDIVSLSDAKTQTRVCKAHPERAEPGACTDCYINTPRKGTMPMRTGGAAAAG